MIATPVGVLAVHYARLVWMQLQTDVGQPCRNGIPHYTGLPLAAAVHHRVIAITLERNARELPGHPRIECVVHEEVANNGEIADPCGVPRSSFTRLPSGCC